MHEHSREVEKVARQTGLTLNGIPFRPEKSRGGTLVLPSHSVRFGRDVEINKVRYCVVKIHGKTATLALCNPGPHGIQRGQHVTIDLVKYGLVKLTRLRAKIELLHVKRKPSV